MSRAVRILVVAMLLVQQVVSLGVVQCFPGLTLASAAEGPIAGLPNESGGADRSGTAVGCLQASRSSCGECPPSRQHARQADQSASARPVHSARCSQPGVTITGFTLPPGLAECGSLWCVVRVGPGPATSLSGTPRPTVEPSREQPQPPPLWARTALVAGASDSISAARLAACQGVAPVEGRTRRALLCVRTI